MQILSAAAGGDFKLLSSMSPLLSFASLAAAASIVPKHASLFGAVVVVVTVASTILILI